MTTLHRRTLALAAAAAAFMPIACAAAVSSVTGKNAPFDNAQPSIALKFIVPTTGDYPLRDGGDTSIASYGMVRTLATYFNPWSLPSADGALLSISQNPALFSVLGTTFGGTGVVSFGLPDLKGRTITGGSSATPIGYRYGERTTTVTVAQMPAHTHVDPNATSVIGSTGGNQPISNFQPSAAVNYVIRVAGGSFPSAGSGPASLNLLGQVAPFLGNYAPGGFMLAQGQTLAIADYSSLFSVIGTTYGGDGQTTFRLPDLRDRTIVGAGDGPERPMLPLGTTLGSAQFSMSLPEHAHSGLVSAGSPNVAFDNTQPSLAMNYLIAVNGGVYPSRDCCDNPDLAIYGEVMAFSGIFAPAGWAFADGRLLSIAENQALFSVLGTTYGGDGVRTFALPDLRGRTVVGEGSGWSLGQVGGSVTVAEAAILPAHVHTITAVPEPRAYGLMLAGLALVVGCVRRRSPA